MTLLDSSLHRDIEGSWVNGRRGSSQDLSHNRFSESRGVRKQESGYHSIDIKGEREMEGDTKRHFRYYERGHPLPSNHVLEPKACVPYRNVNLGVPSQRRNTETYMQETWRSESPQRYTYHSNFKRGDTLEDSPSSRHCSVSPDRSKLPELPAAQHRPRSLSRSGAQTHHSSRGSSRHPSRHTSGRSSPSRRRGSISSRAESPTRVSSHRRKDSFQPPYQDYFPQGECTRKTGSPSQASGKHSLDSENLYRNLEILSCQELPPSSYVNNAFSPTPQKEHHSRLSPSQGSWQGSAHSLLSLPASRGSSTSRLVADSQAPVSRATSVAAMEPDKGLEDLHQISSERSSSNIRRGMDALLTSEPKKTDVVTEDVGMTMEDYIALAAIPLIQLESEEEFSGLKRRHQSPSPCRDNRMRSYREQDEVDLYGSRLESDERGRVRERGRDRKCRDSENGRGSRRPSATSVQSSEEKHRGKHRSSELDGSGNVETQVSIQQKMKGWLLRLDEDGNWMKDWFVLCDSSLRYYRDSAAKESDLNGELDLTSCFNVSDCEVEKNYGLQIQTEQTVLILSAVTSRLRRNWVKLLKQAIQNNRHQSDSCSEKENPLSCGLSPYQRRRPLTCKPTDTNSHAADQQQATDRRHLSDLSPVSQREEGEGWDREQAKRLEERNKWFEEGAPFSEMGSRWDLMELKKGTLPVPVIESLDSEVNRKWTEFEMQSFRDMSPQSLIGAEAYTSPPHESQSQVTSQNRLSSLSLKEPDHNTTGPKQNLSDFRGSLQSINGLQTIQTITGESQQDEVPTFQKQVKNNHKECAVIVTEEDSPCGPGALCGPIFEAIKIAHQKDLQELQERHKKEITDMEKKRDKLLQEERQAATKAMDALIAAHKEEMVKVLKSGGGAHVDSSYRELIDSSTCLDFSSKQSYRTNDHNISSKEGELVKLRRENQELRAKLAEETSRMRCLITGQRTGPACQNSAEHTGSEVEMLLRAKDNEVMQLKKEINCLQNEIQSLKGKWGSL